MSGADPGDPWTPPAVPPPAIYDEDDWTPAPSDDTPTALEPVVVTPPVESPVPSTPERRPRRSPRWPVVVGAAVPAVMFLAGWILFRYARVWDDTGPATSDTTTTVPLPAPATTIAITGDPSIAAAALSGHFAELLAAEDWAGAATTTGNRRTSHYLDQNYSWGPRSYVLISTQPISRNAYQVRVLLSGGQGDKVRYRCERWLVDPTAQAVVPEAAGDPFGRDQLVSSSATEPSPEQLAVAAADRCRSAQLG